MEVRKDGRTKNGVFWGMGVRMLFAILMLEKKEGGVDIGI